MEHAWSTDPVTGWRRVPKVLKSTSCSCSSAQVRGFVLRYHARLYTAVASTYTYTSILESRIIYENHYKFFTPLTQGIRPYALCHAKIKRA